MMCEDVHCSFLGVFLKLSLAVCYPWSSLPVWSLCCDIGSVCRRFIPDHHGSAENKSSATSTAHAPERQPSGYTHQRHWRQWTTLAGQQYVTCDTACPITARVMGVSLAPPSLIPVSPPLPTSSNPDSVNISIIQNSLKVFFFLVTSGYEWLVPHESTCMDARMRTHTHQEGPIRLGADSLFCCFYLHKEEKNRDTLPPGIISRSFGTWGLCWTSPRCF